MREIKFRAYVKPIQWVVPVEEIDFHAKMVEVDLAHGQGDFSDYSFDEVELMQCTGLVDKNGVEIYEGDILKDEENNLWTVEWGKTGYVVFGVELCGNDLLEHGNDYIVAGNIHENPELLP